MHYLLPDNANTNHANNGDQDLLSLLEASITVLNAFGSSYSPSNETSPKFVSAHIQ
jgi:hypothetical protein